MARAEGEPAHIRNHRRFEERRVKRTRLHFQQWIGEKFQVITAARIIWKASLIRP